MSPFFHVRPIRPVAAGAHFPSGGPLRKTPPRAVHFLNLAQVPEPHRLTARIHQHLQEESVQPVFHFRILTERSSRVEFLTLAGAMNHLAGVPLHPETFFKKRIHLTGTDLTTAYQRLLPCLLDYTSRLPMTLADLPADTPRRFLLECILNGHWVYLVLEPEEAQLCQASLLVKSLPARFRSIVRPILMAAQRACLLTERRFKTGSARPSGTLCDPPVPTSICLMGRAIGTITEAVGRASFAGSQGRSDVAAWGSSSPPAGQRVLPTLA